MFKKTDLKRIEEWCLEWTKILTVVENMQLNIANFDQDRSRIDSLLSEGKYAVHHSQAFSQAYDPHYRIIEKSVFDEYLSMLR